MRVEQVMTKQVQCCRPENTLEQAAQLMWDNDCGCLPVCQGDGINKIVGMITDRDITMCALFQGKPLCDLGVADAMAREVRTCHPDDALADAEQTMRDGQIRRLPVVDDDQCVIGMISLADLAQEAVRERTASTQEITEGEVNDTLAEICAPRIIRLAA
jgi:CBS domain-containing protein